VVDLESDLCDHERSVLEQKIVGLEDAAPLRVLDRNERKVHRLIGDAMEGMPERSERLWLGGGEGGVERLFRIGARFPLITDRELAGDARNFSREP
jgi:hypothetical protein